MSTDDAAAQHVTRTLRTLEALAEGPQTQADIARRLDVHRRTARRVLLKLTAEGYVKPVAQGPHTAYEPTAQLIVLGRMVAERIDLAAIGAQLTSVADKTGVADWFFVSADGRGMWFDDAVVSTADRTSRISAPATRREELHAQADGKVFLSADSTLLGEVLNQGLLPLTDRTIRTRADLLLELARVRSRGYATEVREHHVETRAVASGVINHTGQTVAALGAILTDAGDPDDVGWRISAIASAFTNAIGGKGRPGSLLVDESP